MIWSLMVCDAVLYLCIGNNKGHPGITEMGKIAGLILLLLAFLGTTASDTDETTRKLMQAVVDVQPLQSKKAMYLTPGTVYIQRNLTQHIRCPNLPPAKPARTVEWSKEDLSHSYEIPIVRWLISPVYGTNLTKNGHYRMTDSHGLIFNHVELNDGGSYVCRYAIDEGPETKMTSKISVIVLDEQFPRTDLYSSNASIALQRKQQHSIDCPALPANGTSGKPTTYWLLDEDNATHTSIIGAQYSDGEVMIANNYHGDYSITEDGQLVVNSLDKSSVRFVCRIFTDKPGMSSSLIDVTGIVTPKQEFPTITGCDEEKCAVEIDGSDEFASVNCSVSDVYPEVELVWSVQSCDAGDQPIHSATTHPTLYNSSTQTYRQVDELILRANISFNCTFQCSASGSALPSPIWSYVNIICNAYSTSDIPNNKPQPWNPAVIVICSVGAIVVVVAVVVVAAIIKRTGALHSNGIAGQSTDLQMTTPPGLHQWSSPH